MGKKHKKPKIKMRSYGGSEELPIVKSKQGLFKKPEFHLADQKYDNLGHGGFEGQYTGKLEGPSQRAIKGKGKKLRMLGYTMKVEIQYFYKILVLLNKNTVACLEWSQRLKDGNHLIN